MVLELVGSRRSYGLLDVTSIEVRYSVDDVWSMELKMELPARSAGIQLWQ